MKIRLIITSFMDIKSSAQRNKIFLKARKGRQIFKATCIVFLATLKYWVTLLMLHWLKLGNDHNTVQFDYMYVGHKALLKSLEKVKLKLVGIMYVSKVISSISTSQWDSNAHKSCLPTAIDSRRRKKNEQMGHSFYTTPFWMLGDFPSLCWTWLRGSFGTLQLHKKCLD